MTEIQELLAFADGPSGGNPAGVVLDARDLDDAAMLAVAARLGHSESAFVLPASDGPRVRYFSPVAEVPFCGHATIATACALALRDGPGRLELHTLAGVVPVTTAITDGVPTATFSSVEPRVDELVDGDLDEALRLLGWDASDVDPDHPARYAYAGARHLVLFAATRDRLARLDYDYDGLTRFMLPRDLITVCLAFWEDAGTVHTRNPFPVGGTFEDPATGAASAALGGYLRALGFVTPPTRVVVRQGHDMGRPSTIVVDIPAAGPIDITGTAVVLPSA